MTHQLPSTEAPAGSCQAALLDDLVCLLRRFVVIAEHEYLAVALWIVHTHAIDAADTTPYLVVTGPERRCGKTRLLEVLSLLVRQPTMTLNTSEAALFRLVAQEQPTLLLDETDTIFGPRVKNDKESLRGLINGGYRRGAVVLRCEGDGSNQQVVSFPAFCPKSLAGIGSLPDTILDRSLVIEMRRSRPGEKAERLSMSRPPEAAAVLKAGIEAWVVEHLEELRLSEPDLPDELNDRAQDVCEPLLAIADLAGPEFAVRARHALVTLMNAQQANSEESIGVTLLAAIKAAFDLDGVKQLSTDELIQRLSADPEAPWGQWHGQGKIDPRSLARLLKPFGVRSKSLGDPANRGKKGYMRFDFEDPWSRYLIGSAAESTSQADEHGTDVSDPSDQGPLSPMSRMFRESDEAADEPDDSVWN
jgi:hypothetical protein